jgi:hypothetical protein
MPFEDKNLLWTGIVFFIASLLLQVVWWQALLIAVFMSGCWYLSYGQRIIRGLGVVMLLWGMLTWSGVLPSADHYLISVTVR